ncbi:hypothetical protein GNI_093650 [Gregarina niphandrodes]|uniref:Uncharacterized protein n=1 Tax=Gregarina niphandrodes TaxID=110365 RepID=A0A023B562_GRENI|nr:hypothetical protein GNI_093650 [Gregarina niphandrodes]EZG58879.1 hypothetical protein GNI_093650 [Gregarina niphandrodes]|eukprot:XP_011130934.1 hypothetical protein GNI_093650 [Gregarina niphandrodes]
MNAEGIRPPVDDCVVRMLTLSGKSRETDILCAVLVPRDAVVSLTEVRKDVGTEEEACLSQDRRRFDWLERCNRILVYGSPNTINALGDTLVIRELKEYLEGVDPQGNFSHVSDQICHESAGQTMAQLRKVCDLDSDPLQVTACRRLNFEELEDLLQSVPEDWVPALQRSALQCGIFDVESGWSCRSTRCVPNKMCVAVSTGATILSGIAIWALYNWLKPRNSEAAAHSVNGIFNMSGTTSVNENFTMSRSTPMDLIHSVHHRSSPEDTFTSFDSSIAVSMTKEVLKAFQTETTTHSMKAMSSINGTIAINKNVTKRGSTVFDFADEGVTEALETSTSEHPVQNSPEDNFASLAASVAVNLAKEALRASETTTPSANGTLSVDGTATTRLLNLPSTAVSATSPVIRSKVVTSTGPETTTEYTSRFKTTMSNAALDRIRLPWSYCDDLFKSKGFKNGGWSKMGEPGWAYPCRGRSGVLLCKERGTESNNTCYFFGAPWRYDAFAVHDAIRSHVLNNGECAVRCDSEDEMVRHLWEEAADHLLYVPAHVRKRRADFDDMLQGRYPLDKKCSGWCKDDGCVKGDFNSVPDCRCAVSKVNCFVRSKLDHIFQNVESLAFDADTRYMFSSHSAFNAKEYFDVKNCSYECRWLDLDLAKTAVTRRMFEVESTEDTSGFKTRMSSRELRRLALTWDQCRKLFTREGGKARFESVEPLGRYPCGGGSGIWTCRKQQSCHRFGGPWMFDVFAVQDAVRHHLRNDRDCAALCYGPEDMVRDLWQETEANLASFPHHNQTPRREDFNAALSHLYPVNKPCSSSCVNCDENDFAPVKDCLCHVARVNCPVRDMLDNLWFQLESFAYDTSPRDAFRSLSLFNTKEEKYLVGKCDSECHIHSLEL